MAMTTLRRARDLDQVDGRINEEAWQEQVRHMDSNRLLGPGTEAGAAARRESI